LRAIWFRLKCGQPERKRTWKWKAKEEEHLPLFLKEGSTLYSSGNSFYGFPTIKLLL